MADAERIQLKSNIARFMGKHQIPSVNELVNRSNNDPSWYWNAVNDDLVLEWFKKYDIVYDSSQGIPWTKWFVGGRCNIVANAIDRHARLVPDKVAYIFSGDHKTHTVTYAELDINVRKMASAMRLAGVRKGDVVAIYMPMIAEAIYSILACSKIGAVHTTIFSGFNSRALQTRLKDSNASILITSDHTARHGKKIELKREWTKAISGTKIKKVVTVGEPHDEEVVNFSDFLSGGSDSDRDISSQTEVMDSEDPLFMLYTSGTTGEPKGTLQVHGGYMAVAAQQASYLIDMTPDDVLFWYADIGWITGQTWVVYGSSIVGGTSVVYEEALNYPSPDAWCAITSDYNVSILGLAPTAIRYFMKSKVDPSSFDLHSLRILATTGEPINREAWEWYYNKVGGTRCPVINLSGGTEAGGAILSPLPGMKLEPCTVGYPVPGFDAAIYDDDGLPATKGHLVIRKPWPSMTRGLVGDPIRFEQTYWSKFKDVWYHGDIVYVDKSGLWYIGGRTDDAIKVSGHRMAVAEIESAAMSHPNVSEAAAVGKSDEIKGESIVLCVTTKATPQSVSQLKEEISSVIEGSIGKFARPDEIRIVSDLPKTRTGKLVRRLIKAKICGLQIGTSELAMIENPASLDGI
jgi:acetyl-CoA synthetase